ETAIVRTTTTTAVSARSAPAYLALSIVAYVTVQFDRRPRQLLRKSHRFVNQWRNLFAMREQALAEWRRGNDKIGHRPTGRGTRQWQTSQTLMRPCRSARHWRTTVRKAPRSSTRSLRR